MINHGWIYALENYRIKNENSGKWLVFAKSEEKDSVWQRIKDEVIQGTLKNLTIQAKISTIPSFNKKTKVNTYVICIYFEDSYDINVIKQGMKEIRKIVYTGSMFYKTDSQTRSRIYSGNKQKPYLYFSFNKDHFDINKE